MDTRIAATGLYGALRTYTPLIRSKVCITAMIMLIACLAGPGAQALDTGPHFDCTRDALTTEGFGDTAVQVAQVTNWMVDFYSQAGQNPYSGHSSWWKEIFSGAIGYREDWPDTVVDAASWLHFDSAPRFVVGGRQRAGQPRGSKHGVGEVRESHPCGGNRLRQVG